MSEGYRIRCTWYDRQVTYSKPVETEAEAKALARTLGDIGLIIAVAIEPAPYPHAVLKATERKEAA